MPAPRKYPPELRERAMRLVQEARKEDPELSVNQAVIRIGQRVGVNADTLRGWVKQAQIDAGERPGTTTDDASRIKHLEAEVRELKRANEHVGVKRWPRGVGTLRSDIDTTISLLIESGDVTLWTQMCHRIVSAG